MPWSYGLFAYHDRSCYPPFGISILVLHWLSVAWAASFIRGAALTMAEVGCLFYYLAGLIFAIIFLWRKSLAPGMYLHALFDVMALLAV